MSKAKLYIRFPTKIEEELQVKNLCSLIEAVHLPRQKSARWCIVDFKNEDQKKEAMKTLKTVVVNQRHLVLKPVKRKEKRTASKKSDSINTVQELLGV